jgi:hypothetical protein
LTKECDCGRKKTTHKKELIEAIKRELGRTPKTSATQEKERKERGGGELVVK